MTPLLQPLYVLFILSAGYCSGSFFWKKICRDSPPLEHFVASTGLGLALVCLAIFFLGVTGLLYRGVVVAVPLLFLLLGGRGALSDIGRCLKITSSVRPRLRIRYIFWLIFLYIFLLLFILTFLPELEIDAYMYHLSAPKAWLFDHAIHPIPFNMHSQFHFLTQMLNILVYSLPGGGFIASKQIQISYSVLLALTAYLLGRRFSGKNVGAASAVMVLATQEVTQVVRGSMIDGGVGFYIATGIYFLARAVSSKQRRHHAASAVFFGLGFSSKNTGILFLGSAYFAYIIYTAAGDRKNIRSALQNTAFAGVIVFLITLPWILKNLIFTGNPFYPFLMNVFPARWDYQVMAQGFYRYYSGFDGHSNPMGAAGHIFRELPLFIHNIYYIGAHRMGVWMILGALVAGLFRKSISRARQWLAITGFLMFPFFILSPFGRFMMGLFPQAAFLITSSGKTLLRKRYVVNSFLLFMVFLYAGLFTSRNLWSKNEGWRRTISNNYAKKQGYVIYDDMVEYMGKNLSGENDRVLILENNRLLEECPVRFLPNPHMHTKNLIQIILEKKGSKEVENFFEREDVTHIIMNRKTAQSMMELISKWNLEKILEERNLVLFEKDKKN